MTSQVLSISVARQTLKLMSGGLEQASFRISTSALGVGYGIGSHQTPAGNFRICEKIGDGLPLGTIFRARVPVGIWQPGACADDGDLILTRILRLEGIDEMNANTFQRFIYIHGTNHEDQLGQPASHGCIRLANDDILWLFERVKVNDHVEVVP